MSESVAGLALGSSTAGLAGGTIHPFSVAGCKALTMSTFHNREYLAAIHLVETGFGRIDCDVRPALTELYAANPRRSCSVPTCRPPERQGLIKMTTTRWFWRH